MLPKKMFLMDTYLFSTILFFLFYGSDADLVLQQEELTVNINESSKFSLELTKPLDLAVNITLSIDHKGVIEIEPVVIPVSAGVRGPWQVNVFGLNGGHVIVSANVTPNITNFDRAFIQVTCQYSAFLTLFSTIIGWIYFVAWSVSFYPQIYENFTRKSVVGLNFDFLALNLLGFTLYAVFNCGLYWIPSIEAEYFRRHPKGLNPVQLNDIVFAVHAAFATLITIAQCFCFERGNQRISTTARTILGAMILIFITCMGLALFDYIHWLDFLYDCSYIKLTITLIKYIPQSFMNYRRKSTIGWSIANVFLDFTGGLLSIGQMLINSYNFNDWLSIFGDPTKFGLGLFSIFFDILFIVQHYILYRNPYSAIPGDVYVNAPSSEEGDDRLTPPVETDTAAVDVT